MGDKDGSSGKGKAKYPEVRRGIGTGEEQLKDDDFATVVIEGDTALKAKGGKRCIEVMLGYAKNVENALTALGVEVKMPSIDDLTKGKAVGPQTKDGIDPMDPAAYSDTPMGSWSAGMPKQGGQRNRKGSGPGAHSQDSKTDNAERFLSGEGVDDEHRFAPTKGAHAHAGK